MPRSPNGGWYALRFKILERDSYTCRYCGQFAPSVRLEVDHIVAVSDGGTEEESNLVTSCYACNRGKEGLRIRPRVGVRKVSHIPLPKPDGRPVLRHKIADVLRTNATPLSVNDIQTALEIDGSGPQADVIRITLNRHKQMFEKMMDGRSVRWRMHGRGGE